MNTPEDPRRDFRIACAGVFARRAVQNSARGKVEAVFEHSFYATIDDRWICILPSRAGMGPLNARCNERGLEHSIQRYVRVDDEVVVESGSLSVGAKLSFNFQLSNEWRPALLSRCEPHSVAHGLSALLHHLSFRPLPANGIELFLSSDSRQAVECDSGFFAAAKRPLENFYAALCEAMASGKMTGAEAGNLFPLLGLGPGLTPAGDDIIGGTIITLHRLGLARVREALWVQVKPSLQKATNRISIAHMKAAAEGYGHEAVHDLINSVLSGHTGSLDRQLDAVATIGHTSGLDALVGVILTTKAWLRVHEAAASLRLRP